MEFELTPLQDLLKGACDDTIGSERQVRFNGPYGGRGMFGKKCPAVSGKLEHIQLMLADIVVKLADEVRGEMQRQLADETSESAQELEVIHHYFHDMINQIMVWAWDSLGYDMIVYWKDVEWIEEEQDVEG